MCEIPKWQSMHYPKAIPVLTGTFTLTAIPSTDVYDAPPSTHRFDAPFIYQASKVKSFRSAQVTVSAAWLKQYDQGGIMVSVTSSDGTHRWVKSGVELLDGAARLGTVCKDVWADWSLAPILAADGRSTTVLFEAGPGKPLWVYAIDDKGTRHALREFNNWAALEHDAELKVGVYVAKPASDGDLEVEFNGLEVVLS